MPAVELSTIPEAMRLTPADVMDAESLRSLPEVYSRLMPGDALELTWAMAPRPEGSRGPKMVKVIDARSLTPAGRERWGKKAAKDRMENSQFFQECEAIPKAAASLTTEPAKHQGEIFLRPEIETLDAPYTHQQIAQQRLEALEPLYNGAWRKDYGTRDQCLEAMAARLQVSIRTMRRWKAAYEASGKGFAGLRALIKDQPGPEPGRKLEDWMQHFVFQEVLEGLTRERCYDELLAEKARRQAAWGPAKIYTEPTRSAVYRYFAKLRSKAPIEARLSGRDAVKASAMQISRTYDCHSLDRVDADEWITDVFAYDSDNLIWRSGKRKGQIRVGRFYLVTMLDERAIYPLDFCLVEFPNAEDEIDLLVRVIQRYGVPGLLNTDRGRFRGHIFGGEFRQFDRDAMRERANGILGQLQIGRNMPREHNPQGCRLERFHLELARFCREHLRGRGWCGADTDERQQQSTVDSLELPAHERWVKGQGTEATPLLSRDELAAKFLEFFAWWRSQHQSEGTDMKGLTPHMVFNREAPPDGFRQVSPEELDRKTSRLYEQRVVQTGGTVEISEGPYQVTRYYSHELLFLQGQRRDVLRSRYDRSRIRVLPAVLGETEIVAPVMPRVGVSDPEKLGQAIAEKQFSRHLIEVAAPTRELSSVEYKLGLEPLAPRSADAIASEEFISERAARHDIPSLHDLDPFDAADVKEL